MSVNKNDMNKEIKLIAFDLDGTFLDDKKDIPPENLEAVDAAAEMGIIIVPATGRLFKAMPEEFRARKHFRYYLLINGAYVYDSLENRVIYKGNIPQGIALQIMEYGDTLPCLYDIYSDGTGYMNQTMYDVLDDYMPDKNYLKMMRSIREGVPDLKEVVRAGREVQKMQYFFTDIAERNRQIPELQRRFPDCKVSSSLATNIEINYKTAGKGLALNALCRELGVSIENAAAFGDGTNDTEMISCAGVGIAMKNAAEPVKAVADMITEEDNNAGGVGRTIKRLLGL